MRPISQLPAEEARALRGLLFDLDDTFLDGTRLSGDAFCALEALASSGLRLVAVTGRPAAWGALLCRQWPLVGVVSENGAIADYLEQGRWHRMELSSGANHHVQSTRLRKIVEETQTTFTALRPTNDVQHRISDFTFDIGEYARVDPAVVDAAIQFAQSRGARTARSSVHLHLTLDPQDKASGVIAFLRQRLQSDVTACRYQFAFVGDSENDAACFAAFRTTVGVANLAGRPTVGPRYITRARKSAGFVELANRLLSLRSAGPVASPGRFREPPASAKHESMSEEQELIELAQKRLYPNYRQPPIVLEKGEGAVLWDASGRRYLDMMAGIAVSVLGHAHPALTSAIRHQSGRLLHVSNYFYNEPNVRLADKLCRVTEMDRAFFCNSGTEAIEAMLKLARRHFYARGERDRCRIVAFEQSFHGRTLGALAATGQPGYREGFGPLSPVSHVPFGDLAAVRQAMNGDVAAILVEPIQGEGGVVPAPAGFLDGLRAIADGAGALLLADEVQTGVGRTGRFLAFQHGSVRPDAVALAKGLGGGVPIGAMLAKEQLADALPPGSHGSTFGGNPLASAAALAVLDTIERDDLVVASAHKGEHLARRLVQIARSHASWIETERGIGLLRGLVLREQVDARAVLGKIRDAGVLLTLAGGRALRFSPPLTVTLAQLDEAVEIIDQVLGEL